MNTIKLSAALTAAVLAGALSTAADRKCVV